MSANLDKGLDEIIAGASSGAARRTLSGKKSDKARPNRGFKKAGAATSSKTLGKALAAASGARNNKGPRPQATAAANPLEAARRAVVSNMPSDVSADDARAFFASRVGRIKQVTGRFRQDGRPSGEFTFTFDAPGKALELMNKFNGQPVDGGKTKLAVQILLDASAAQAPPKPLSERIGKLGSLPAQPVAPKKKRNNLNSKPAAKKGEPAKAAKSKAEPAKAVRAKAKKAAPKKPRTAADLDAEMSDYFAAADKNEISV